MTEKRKILLNIFATYSRSVYVLICGIFISRWVLMALGEVDYGLFGVVGSLTVFVTFINTFLSAGVGRFYGLSVGKERSNYKEGLDDCHKWFTTAVVIHTVVPLILIIVGYPIGIWAIENFLTIPPDRIAACVWVWRFSCLSCFVAMVSVPFSAMYNAKQEIAELTIYSFVTTTLNVIFLYNLASRTGKWLVVYAAWTCLIAIVPQIIICLRAFLKYPEIRLRKKHLNCWPQIKEMLSYCGWLSIGGIADICKVQAMAVLVNKYYGPSVNAAMTIGTQVSNQTTTFCGSLTGALWPAIYNAWGEGNRDRAIRMASYASKIATIGVMIFAVPLILEIDEVLNIWLDKVPDFTGGLCVCYMLMHIADKTSAGYGVLVNANGKMAIYQIGIGITTMLCLPVSWLLFKNGYNVYSAGITIAVSSLTLALVRVLCVKYLLDIGIRSWVRNTFLPLFEVFIMTLVVGMIPVCFMETSIIRILITTILSEATLFCATWLYVLNHSERSLLKEKINNTYIQIKSHLKKI